MQKRTFLTVLLFVAMAMLIPGTALAQGGGGGSATPDQAVALDAQVNSANLQPIEQHWFKFEAGGEGNVMQSLSLEYTPDETYTRSFVLFKVFEEDQLNLFFEGDTSNMTVLGQGTLIVQDQNPDTGELTWTGWVLGGKTYYIQVENGSDFPIDYKLFTDQITRSDTAPTPPVVEEEPPAVAEDTPDVAEDPSQLAPEPEPAFEPLPLNQGGTTPFLPSELSLTEATRGSLESDSTGWYTFGFPDPDNQQEERELVYTVFVTPVDGNTIRDVNIQLFKTGEAQQWAGAGTEGMTNFGAGMVNVRHSRAGDFGDGDAPGQIVWRGSVLAGDEYLVSVENGTDHEIDYHIFPADVIDVELGPKSLSPPAIVFEPGESPETAFELDLEARNDSQIQPGEQAWHFFKVGNLDDVGLEEVDLTMVFTPDDGNRIHNVNFDVFRAGDVAFWSHTDLSNLQIESFGSGGIVVRDDNPVTGERFWNGWVVDGDLYLVQIRNGSDIPIDYHLFVGDVYAPSLAGPN